MGGPEPNKYKKREEQHKQAENNDGHSEGRDATLKMLQSVRDSQNQPSSQLGDGSDYVTRGNMQHLGSHQSGYEFGNYGPGGPRSESGSSVTSGSSIFGGGGSIGGQFDGPKDSQPPNANVGNLELGARIWLATRSVSLTQSQSYHAIQHTFHLSHRRYIRLLSVASRWEVSLVDASIRLSQDAADRVLTVSIRFIFHNRRPSHISIFSFFFHQISNTSILSPPFPIAYTLSISFQIPTTHSLLFLPTSLIHTHHFHTAHHGTPHLPRL